MVKQVRAQVTRDSIVAGAASVFARRGYGLASIAEIAAESGTTKGALYFHFPSKDDLARAVIDEEHQRTMDASETVIAEGLPALETLVELCRVVGGQVIADPIVRAGIRLITDVATFDPPVATPYVDRLQAVEQLFRRAMDEGDIAPPADPAALARVLVAAFTGIQVMSETLTGHRDLLVRLREFWAVLIPGIVAPARLDDLRRLPDLLVA